MYEWSKDGDLKIWEIFEAAMNLKESIFCKKYNKQFYIDSTVRNKDYKGIRGEDFELDLNPLSLRYKDKKSINKLVFFKEIRFKGSKRPVVFDFFSSFAGSKLNYNNLILIPLLELLFQTPDIKINA